VAKSGVSSGVSEAGGGRSDATRRQLIDAAIETLKKEGFVGASARAIAAEAGTHQSLVFYHFGSVSNLLLAALDAVSADRLEQYGRMVAAAGSSVELVEAAADVFRTDLDAGYLTVLVELIAGASSSVELGREVAARIGPWREFAERAVDRAVGPSIGALVPAADVAYAIVALYLGLEMLSQLDGNRQPALDLFSHARQLAQSFEGLTEFSAPEASA
jgi:AcrR family transcriptional regulator